MGRLIMCMVFVGIVAVVLMQYVAAQTVHVVGDSMGWTVPNSGGEGSYITWAASKRFVVGDILTFDFTTNAHDVLQVPKASYDACTSSNPIGNLITTGPANVTLDSIGDHYYICTFGQHCQLGQKLFITVNSASPGASPTPMPSPPTTSTPSPAPTSGHPASGPAGSNVPPVGTPNSSSSMVLASVFVSMLSIVMGLVF